jgi:hypothetical protein
VDFPINVANLNDTQPVINREGTWVGHHQTEEAFQNLSPSLSKSRRILTSIVIIPAPEAKVFGNIITFFIANSAPRSKDSPS